MKPDFAEYKPVVKKLLQKTRDGKVSWQTPSFGSIRFGSGDWFESTVGSEQEGLVSFIIAEDRDDSSRSLIMKDQGGNQIFSVSANDLPTSPDEEELSALLDELYEFARRQALKVDEKIELASTLLDRV